MMSGVSRTGGAHLLVIRRWQVRDYGSSQPTQPAKGGTWLHIEVALTEVRIEVQHFGRQPATCRRAPILNLFTHLIAVLGRN
mmetsp:Transcript_44183/g.127824  ORF Transcript_44183/g.127824 Transcript_44183/m.127824 type:complete len:82 (+) Transcript_44183:768-1013(+)